MNVPVTGLVPEVMKVAPDGKPDAVRVTVSELSGSVAVTVKVRVAPTVAVSVAGAVIVGGRLTRGIIVIVLEVPALPL